MRLNASWMRFCAALSELAADPGFELTCLIDSLIGAERLAGEARAFGLKRPVRVLLEAGILGGRTGVRSLVAAGRSILLTTHYLEEADALASRIVVLNRGRIVADGTPASIKQQAAGRQIRCQTRLTHAALLALPGVQRVEDEPPHGVRLLTTDADQTLRALLREDQTACNLDLRSVGLEDAFLALTGSVH